jgi:hypothetical protein
LLATLRSAACASVHTHRLNVRKQERCQRVPCAVGENKVSLVHVRATVRKLGLSEAVRRARHFALLRDRLRIGQITTMSRHNRVHSARTMAFKATVVVAVLIILTLWQLWEAGGLGRLKR